MTASAQLRILYGGHSDKGAKAENEDAYAALLPSTGMRTSKGMLAVMADGASCSMNARIASQTAVLTFINDYMSTPDTWDVKTSAARVLSALNSWLYCQGSLTGARHNALVTTFSALVCKSRSVHLLHCGDSRIWRWRDAQLQQLSDDHCMIRPDGSAALSRALGMDTQLKVDYQQRGLREGDVLLLTTDGVHGTLSAKELQALLAQTLSEEDLLEPAAAPINAEGADGTLEACAAAIVAAALQAGSSDNLSCLLLKVTQLPAEDMDEVHRKLTKRAVPPVLEPGQRIDDYTIVRVLHSGTRSHVYLASHPRYSKLFVLKAPSPNCAEDPQYLEAFLREQWVGRRLDHPGLMKIHESALDSRFLYHVCEYIEGASLRQWLYDNPRPDLNIVRGLVKQIAVALRALQRMGMQHRDLKPENIMLTPSGTIKLIDFGTVLVSGLRDNSSLLEEAAAVGTLSYMAPEYLQGESGEYRSDIFSLGVVTYECLAGRLPFSVRIHGGRKAPPYSAWHYRSVLEQRADLPQWVDLCLARACAPRPSQRYPALSEFLHDLDYPNAALLRAHQQRPLIEKDPVRFWRWVSGLLLCLLVLQSFFLAAHPRLGGL
ncbi:MAG TPA: protein kinase [Pseudomonadaceae bacterium]|nr:protein kinase [Pseudomonadaceae bacterium]